LELTILDLRRERDEKEDGVPLSDIQSDKAKRGQFDTLSATFFVGGIE
jgi:hypothetical protein